MVKFSESFERWVSIILMVFAMIVVVYQVVQLIYTTAESVYARTSEIGLQYSPEYTKHVAIVFFNILLMLEIMQTLKVFAHGHVIKAKIILIVCLIAVSRKVLALGEGASEPLVEIALGVLILTLSLGYYLVSRVPSDKSSDTH